MYYSFSTFHGKFGVEPTVFHCDDISDFIDTLDFIFESQILPATSKAKDASLMISAAIYKDGLTRKLVNIDHISKWIGLDFDNGFSIPECRDILDQHGLAYWLSTTTSHTSDHHKFRVILFFDRAIETAEYSRVWKAVSNLFDGQTDPAAKDASRMYSAPAKWQYRNGSESVKAHNRAGKPLCVDALLATQPVKAYDASAVHVVVPRQDAGELQDIPRHILTDLYTSPVVSQYIIDKYNNSRARGIGSNSALFSFMCSVATKAAYAGINITASDLADLAREMVFHSPFTTSKENLAKLDKDSEKVLNMSPNRAQQTVTMNRVKYNLLARGLY